MGYVAHSTIVCRAVLSSEKLQTSTNQLFNIPTAEEQGCTCDTDRVPQLETMKLSALANLDFDILTCLLQFCG